MHAPLKPFGSGSLILSLALAVSAGAQSPEPYRTRPSVNEPAYFEINALRNAGLDGGPSFASFVTAGGNNVFEFAWFYRVVGDPSNFAFNDASGGAQVLTTPATYMAGPPESGLNVGSMNLSWQNVDGRGFDADWTTVVTQAGPDRATAEHRMQITNPGLAPLQIELLLYADCDVDGSILDRDNRPAPGDRFTVFDQVTRSFVDMVAIPAPTHWEVDSFGGDLDQRINTSGAAYDLADTGMPFMDGDWTGAFQWSVTVQPMASADVTAVLGRNICFNAQTAVAQATPYGSGLGGANGSPRINSGLPIVGLEYLVQIGNGPSGGNATVFIGGSATALPLCNLTILVNPWITVDVPLNLVGSGDLPLRTPCDSGLFGAAVFLQAFVIDPTSSSPCFPLTHSAGLRADFGS